MPTRSGTVKPVRPILAGSVSADVRDLTSSSTDSERKPRRHSVTTDVGSRDATGTLKPDGSLRKVSRWFRDFKMKMDPIKVKDRIRYSRPSLDRQANVNDEEEEENVNVFRRHGKTATMGTRRSGRKQQLEKRFNSMENLPGTEVLRPQNIRKMKSLQLDANDDELETDSTLQAYFLTELTQREAESLDGMTEAISLKLNEKEKLFNEILQSSSQNQCCGQTQTSDVKLTVLASESLVTELTHLINVSVQPENLHLKQQEFHQHQQPDEHQQQPLQPTTTMVNTTTPETEIISKNPIFLYIDDSSKFVDILGRLQSQLSTLLVALDENSVKVNRLKMKIGSVKLSTEAERDHSLLPLPDPNSSTSRQEKTFRHRSLSDSECFLSLINDLGDSPDANEYTTI